MCFVLMNLGGLNLTYLTLISAPLPILLMAIAVLATPSVTELPSLSVAVIGAVIAPISPEPIPLKNPFAPSYLVFYIGLVTSPVTPPINSPIPPFTPLYSPSNTCSDF